MGWIVAALLFGVTIWLLRANYRCEKRWRAARYAWTKLADKYIAVPVGGEWPEIAGAHVLHQKKFLSQFGIVPLSLGALTLYETALIEFGVERLD